MPAKPKTRTEHQSDESIFIIYSANTRKYLIDPYYVGPYWRNVRVIGEIKAGEKAAEKGRRKRGQKISPKIQVLANILFLLNSNKSRIFSTGYSKLDL